MHKHDELFKRIAPDTVVSCVTEAFDKLNHGFFKDVAITSMALSKQVICGLFHELIVHEVSQQPLWRTGKPKIEADLVHASGLQLQVKTSSSMDGIAGNRYASENLYSDPSEYYLCVNFIPFVSICKIRAGFLPSSSWKPQTGKGNAATIKKEVLDILPFLPGTYLRQLPLLSVRGIGKKTSQKLKDNGYSTLWDIKTPHDIETIHCIIGNSKISQAIIDLCTSNDVISEKEGYNEKDLSLLRL